MFNPIHVTVVYSTLFSSELVLECQMKGTNLDGSSVAYFGILPQHFLGDAEEVLKFLTIFRNV
jgi:hypothetical protein